MSDPEDIRAWQRLSDRITTSGRLLDGDPERLAGIGVAHVINLAMPDHEDALADEDAKMEAAGLRYTHIAMPFDAPTEQHYAEFVAALEGSAQPVHVHCIANWRVSAFFYRYHREHGMAEEEARAVMSKQWEPDKAEFPAARPWGEFIGRTKA